MCNLVVNLELQLFASFPLSVTSTVRDSLDGQALSLNVL